MTRKVKIELALKEEFAPEYMEVTDESYKHAAGPEAQSHFKVVVVSTHFAGKRLLARHRAVNEALADEFAAGMHALAIHTFTPEEWAARNEQAEASPNCMGGG